MINSTTSNAIENDKAIINLINKIFEKIKTNINRNLPSLGQIILTWWKITKINILFLNKKMSDKEFVDKYTYIFFKYHNKYRKMCRHGCKTCKNSVSCKHLEKQINIFDESKQWWEKKKPSFCLFALYEENE